MVLVNNYVYCCGGLTMRNSITKSCERFNLFTKHWQDDVPDMQEEKFSMTIILIQKIWLYSFGGASNFFDQD